jgi:hypothetical protein
MARAPLWTKQEIAILRDVFPGGGVNAAADALPDRTWQAINVMACKLGIKSGRVSDAPKGKLQGAELEEAIKLREVNGWSFEKIGLKFGVCEISAQNAVLIALCPRKGFTPAQRDRQGRLTPEGIERLRLALRRGAKAVDIMLRLGLSAGRVALERRRYSAELKAAGKVSLPPPGKDLEYSGRRIPADKRRQVEQLLLQGYGSAKVHERTGVSKTHILRTRTKLVKRLARKGECLAGCDIKGVRHVQLETSKHIRADQVAALRAKLLNRVPVRRAALEVGIGGSSAYKIRDALRAELAARGEQLPSPTLPGFTKSASPSRRAAWLPKGSKWIYRYRELLRTFDPEAAKAKLLEEHAALARAAALAAKPRTFDEQLAAVRNGARLVNVRHIRRPDPTGTLGGVATGAL